MTDVQDESPVGSDEQVNIKLLIEYDGTSFYGSQLQLGKRTVQGELEQALRRLTQEDTRVALSGRTDAGVHAQGQVANFLTRSRHDAGTFVRALNALVPDDLAVRRAERVGPDFHSRFSAVSRHYRYTIYSSPSPSPLLRLYSMHVKRELDLAGMSMACRLLVGEQDFAAFAGRGRGVPAGDDELEPDEAHPGTTRTVHQAELSCAGETGRENGGNLIIFDIVANAFLSHMVRNIVGTLLWVGRGKIDWRGFATILRAKDRRLAGPTAPPHGLCLMKVTY